MQAPHPLRSRRARGLLAFGTIVATLLVGNAVILTAHVWARSTTGMAAGHAGADTQNVHIVDDKLIRGGRPTEDTYRYLAKIGVTTVVDLRAEDGIERPAALLRRLGIKLVHIPMRDGQAPTDAQVDRFLTAVRTSRGKVYVHCMAGVGRTGTMVASYLIREKGLDPVEALMHNLSVGPPSLEQIAFATEAEAPGPLVTTVSRMLDAPRRLWTYVN